jgi:site-specific recombinase XerC
MNKVLKEVGLLAGLSKILTTHVGRHTFGTLYAHQSGSIFEVMKAMGISKFETAQVYINLSEEL